MEMRQVRYRECIQVMLHTCVPVPQSIKVDWNLLVLKRNRADYCKGEVCPSSRRYDHSVYATSEYLCSSDSDQSACLLSPQHVGSEMNIVLIPSCYEAPPGMQHRSPGL